MAINYTWDVSTCDTYPTKSGKSNVVHKVHWVLKATDDTNNDSDKSLQEGVSMIQSKIDKIFTEREIVSFCEVGDILDSDLHDALMVKQEKNKKDNEILEVFEKGYKYRNRVIRHAKVVVNKS